MTTRYATPSQIKEAILHVLEEGKGRWPENSPNYWDNFKLTARTLDYRVDQYLRERDLYLPGDTPGVSKNLSSALSYLKRKGKVITPFASGGGKNTVYMTKARYTEWQESISLARDAKRDKIAEEFQSELIDRMRANGNDFPSVEDVKATLESQSLMP